MMGALDWVLLEVFFRFSRSVSKFFWEAGTATDCFFLPPLRVPVTDRSLLAIAENWQCPPPCAFGVKMQPSPPFRRLLLRTPRDGKNDGSRNGQANEERRIEDQREKGGEGRRAASMAWALGISGGVWGCACPAAGRAVGLTFGGARPGRCLRRRYSQSVSTCTCMSACAIWTGLLAATQVERCRIKSRCARMGACSAPTEAGALIVSASTVLYVPDAPFSCCLLRQSG